MQQAMPEGLDGATEVPVAGVVANRAHQPLAPGRAWLAIAILLLIYIFAFIDRQILTLLVKPIQQDLGIGDLQTGLLLGPAFGIFYVVCGIFIGRLVDRLPRRAMIGAGVAVWASATAAGGFVRSYAGLFASRMGVGVGESVLTPAAHAIIAESFPARRLSTAIAIYSSGVAIGSSLAIAIGGLVVHWAGDQALTVPVLGPIRPWNLVLLAVGLSTFLILPLVLFLPDSKAPQVAAAPGEAEGLWMLLKRNWRIFILVPLGFGCTNIVVNAIFAWIPALLQRSFGWEASAIGSAIGIQHALFGLAGQLGTAMLADWLFARRMTDAHTRVQLWSLLVSIPLLALGLVSGSAWMVLLLSTPFIMLSFPFLGYANAAVQLLTPSRFRGRVSAIFLAIVTVMGTLFGAPLVGLATQAGGMALGSALALTTLLAGLAGVSILAMAGRALRAAHAGGLS